MRSILRLELWRSNARWLALLMVVATLAVGSPGRGLTALALDQRQAQFQALAVAMGTAAWYARRDRRSRMDELLATTARPRWQRVLPGAAALAIAAVAAYLVSFAIGARLVVAAEPPRVCTARVHEPALATLRGPAGEALAVLAAAGVLTYAVAGPHPTGSTAG